ncbi:hypothetical protein PV728_38480 [Streptomyces europaeiscabiei]|uniref:hypothetical protein n=1 Tax=Streptomyces TaxID=1883 RepID=UPI0011806F40|nr:MULTISPECIES: hypothetical protein [Streptomyces]MDX3636024.1 hypothetical protein [Streptomyces europaeiscabiei]MDX3654100.1 hypothetical protein [Streptomyces europaeiscabiei]
MTRLAPPDVDTEVEACLQGFAGERRHGAGQFTEVGGGESTAVGVHGVGHARRLWAELRGAGFPKGRPPPRPGPRLDDRRVENPPGPADKAGDRDGRRATPFEHGLKRTE